MIRIPGGWVRTGSDSHYPEERPVAVREIAPFWIDRCCVTNREFGAFVAETGWRTVAERRQPAGSMVFTMTQGPADLRRPDQWWRFVPGAAWHAPEGPDSSVVEQPEHPVVHVALEDAAEFARWRGARLPTEWEWEAAARGGLEGAAYCWGDEFSPQGVLMANVWTGAFPWYFSRGEAPGTRAVGSFPVNGYGLADMAGNVWQWTTSKLNQGCGCTPAEAGGAGVMMAVRGGSYLCAAEYCLRYRPAARIGVMAEATTGHIGFRCAR